MDLGREQWGAIKRAQELQRWLDAAAADKELAFLKGRLEGLAAVVAGVAEERAAAATLRSRAEAAEASLSTLQVRSGSTRAGLYHVQSAQFKPLRKPPALSMQCTA